MTQTLSSTPLIEGSFFDYELKLVSPHKGSTEQFRGKARAILLVNTASKCGLTGQLEGLQGLYERYRSQGLVILGVPSNDFLSQEPLEGGAIQEFCVVRYGVDFPLTEKVSVKGKEATSLYRWLGEYEKPQWNFHKYLFNKEGFLVATFSPITQPSSSSLEEAIKSLLSDSSDCSS